MPSSRSCPYQSTELFAATFSAVALPIRWKEIERSDGECDICHCDEYRTNESGTAGIGGVDFEIDLIFGRRFPLKSVVRLADSTAFLNSMVDEIVNNETGPVVLERVELGLVHQCPVTLLVPLPDLTERERAVMQCVVEGLPNKLIADQLDISVRTVEVHRSRVFDKMEVKSAVELANLMRTLT